MSRLSFKVHGAPVPQGRPRFTRNGRIYTPKTSTQWRKRVADAAEVALLNGPEFPAGAPLDVFLSFSLPIPESWPKWKREAAERGQVAHLGKPDADNLAKAVLDGLNGALFTDDAQVVRLNVAKGYATADAVGVFIDVKPIPFPITSATTRNPAKATEEARTA